MRKEMPSDCQDKKPNLRTEYQEVLFQGKYSVQRTAYGVQRIEYGYFVIAFLKRYNFGKLGYLLGTSKVLDAQQWSLVKDKSP